MRKTGLIGFLVISSCGAEAWASVRKDQAPWARYSRMSPGVEVPRELSTPQLQPKEGSVRVRKKSFLGRGFTENQPGRGKQQPSLSLFTLAVIKDETGSTLRCCWWQRSHSVTARRNRGLRGKIFGKCVSLPMREETLRSYGSFHMSQNLGNPSSTRPKLR